jgi:hypothetical protein
MSSSIPLTRVLPVASTPHTAVVALVGDVPAPVGDGPSELRYSAGAKPDVQDVFVARREGQLEEAERFELVGTFKEPASSARRPPAWRTASRAVRSP